MHDTCLKLTSDVNNAITNMTQYNSALWEVIGLNSVCEVYILSIFVPYLGKSELFSFHIHWYTLWLLFVQEFLTCKISTLKVFYFKYSFSIDIFLSSVDLHPVLKADSIKYVIIFRNMVRSWLGWLCVSACLVCLSIQWSHKRLGKIGNL